jgi:hypothetical protein
VRRAVLIVLPLAAPGAVACGDDDGADAQPFVDALAEEFQNPEEEGDVALEEDDARCVAENTVDIVGADTLEDAEITPEELAASDGPQDFDELEITEDEAHDLAAVFGECGLSYAELLSGPDAPPDAVRCIEDALDEEAVIDAVAQEYLGNEDEANEAFNAVFTDLAEACPGA